MLKTNSNTELLEKFMCCFERSVKRHEDIFMLLFFKTDKDALELALHGRMEELRKYYKEFYINFFKDYMIELAKTNKKAKLALTTALEDL